MKKGNARDVTKVTGEECELTAGGIDCVVARKTGRRSTVSIELTRGAQPRSKRRAGRA